MDLDREQLVEAGVAAGVVGTMILTLYAIGQRYTEMQEVPWTDEAQRQLTATGGEFAVFAVVFFVLLMAAAGLVLAYTVEAPENGDPDGA